MKIKKWYMEFGKDGQPKKVEIIMYKTAWADFIKQQLDRFPNADGSIAIVFELEK